jgi:hypothetical protein
MVRAGKEWPFPVTHHVLGFELFRSVPDEAAYFRPKALRSLPFVCLRHRKMIMPHIFGTT